MSLSSSGCIIDQIIALAYDPSEVIEFLSTKKGFERFSSDYSSKIVFTLPVVHVVAAKQFETAEEAEEWLGYVVHRMGDGSINKLERPSDDIERTALQVACYLGNFIGVNWLVAHGAIANSKPSPYLCACASTVDQLAKILLLEEHGYRFSAEAIFYAAGAVFSSAT
ncbi:uncharacterized protein, partial [Oscarella lobularis]|uniref:uncharacterized protein n=1 Tax=Oscarella lobularis TaxID=121494 RepID=UPI003313BE24